MLLTMIGVWIIGVIRCVQVGGGAHCVALAEQEALSVAATTKRPEGWCKHPRGHHMGLRFIWACALSPSSYVAAGKSVVVPALRCPTCLVWLMRWGGYWRWLRAPLLIERIWIRRGRCAVCRRTHALLPDLVLARRLDGVAVIGRGIALRVITNVGLRPIATQLDVPHSTVRTWWHRFRTRSPTTLAHCSALAVALVGHAAMDWRWRNAAEPAR